MIRTRRDRLESILEHIGLEDVFESADGDRPCPCTARFEDRTLIVDADDCDGGGDLTDAEPCRRTVVETLVERGAKQLMVRSNGLEYRYDDRGVALFAAAGRFLELLGDRHERLAETTATDPLAVADELRSRVDRIAELGAESGLLAAADGIESYADVEPAVGLEIGHYVVDGSIDCASLRDIRSLETGSEARIYTRPDGVPLYALDVVDLSLSADDRSRLLEGYEAIAAGTIEGERTASRAIERVTDGPADPRLSPILEKHTAGYGVLEDLFADPEITDVYATSPVAANPLRAVVDGEAMATNVRLTEDGARAVGSRVRRTSGRAFSRATPTVDATAGLENGTELRIAGVTDPVADGTAFAFREQADDRFTLPALVANGTMPADAAAVLSIAIEQNAAALIAGTRGAGKTTLLGTLLYELPPSVRTVVIEDTPELPVDPLQAVGRDVQALRTGTGDGPEITPANALRTALRLGDGALVVGEIRGEEASVLYEAMRVGANANAVLGTIHGDGADDVYERVVSDLGVEPSSFGATDMVVTVQAYRTVNGRKRRLARIEEVVGSGDEVRFEPLYAIEGDSARSTGRIDRGESRLVERLTGPDTSYTDIRDAIDDRRDLLASLAADGRTTPNAVASAYAKETRVR
ncbi:ATPase, T2SS/T4P/T4SS family [Natronobacterium gregoryi]|uniref:ATPase, type IV secretory pathway VirB11 component like protein n=2 Tax=Natronobacterium gregoryi TaxID=44930 RepID=L0AF55_NATGS|nr:ATPase, T2SS/T4P/T4SS family [Natronobacterium gregoryi]AFZ72548.1 ATPase, type IV secretory pathway VirB11 component like protein [Natronobacterium gregoryi SP2]ELY74158.1 type II secretion system protein E [Natronobacterium gregoryi SP2]PLK21516.1 type II secretion protein [Natronobacterium gregoryi SP2]SFI75787.1 Type IV secretory pathway ATPase VirB11/Archaellum biosynthesis ATPase [Natronobacterium gregoryi]